MFPTIVEVFGINISTYGVLVAIGVLVAYFLILKYAKKEGLDANNVENTLAFAVVSGLVFARLAYVIEHPEHVSKLLDVVAVWQGGMSFFGGLIGGIGGALFGIYKYKLPLWKSADIAVLGLSIAHAIGRLGCTSAGCCYGRPIPTQDSLDAGFHFMDRFPFFYVVFPPGAVAPPYMPLYPTQTMEFIGLLILFVVLMLLYNRKKIDGLVFSAYMIGYGLLRFFLEFFRGVTPPIESIGLTWNQLVSMGMVITAILLFVNLKRSETYGKVD